MDQHLSVVGESDRQTRVPVIVSGAAGHIVVAATLPNVLEVIKNIRISHDQHRLPDK